MLTIDIGLGFKIEHIFIIADVVRPIIGIDILRKFEINISPHLNKITSNRSDKILDINLVLRPNNLPVYNIECLDERVAKIVQEFPSVFNEEPNPSQIDHKVVHYIETEGAPVSVKARKLSFERRNEARNIIDKLLTEGTIRPSRSPWGSPIHLVPKKSKSWRLVGDYRLLNAKTKRDNYPLPLLKDFTVNLAGNKIFSTLDLKDAYHQIKINENDVEKTAIVTPFGSFEYLRMSFGLCGAAQTFQRFIDMVLRDLRDEAGERLNIFGYLDDILLASKDEASHHKHLRILIERLSTYGLKVNSLKCKFFQEELQFLGHRLNALGITPLQEQVEAIRAYNKPQTLKELRRYLGFLNFYHSFIRDAAKLLAPLTALLSCSRNTRNSTKIVWNDEASKAFEASKNVIAEETQLYHYDPTAETSIMVDASDIAVGGVLQQMYKGQWRPVSFFSKKLSQAQRSYSTFSKELYAISSAIKKFRHYVEGTSFFVMTDHKPILNAFVKKTARDLPREERYLEYIALYTTDIRHVSGEKNPVADALSRHFESKISSEAAADDDEELMLGALFATPEFDIAQMQQEDPELKDIMEGKKKITPDIVKEDNLYYAAINNNKRIYVPAVIRQKVIKDYHNTAHPGIRSTKKYLCSKYFWPSMNTEINDFVKSCVSCQRGKVYRHNKALISEIPQANGKFEAIHVDLVGPLAVNKGYRYLLTVVDRFSRWCEAIPLPDITTETVINNLLLHWIARYGVPKTITSDRGAQFTSNMWEVLNRTLGSKHICTTAYHPQSNGLVERFHRRLKDSLRCQSDNYPLEWYTRLPFILLTIRTSIREDFPIATSQTVYGCELNLPSDLLLPRNNHSYLDVGSYTYKLMKAMHVLPHVKSRPQTNYFQLDPALDSCTHVFVKNNAKIGLQPNYKGPFLVLSKNPKYFTIQLANKVDQVSIDRLKAAHFTTSVLTQTRCYRGEEEGEYIPQRSRYGRIYRRPVRYPN